MLCLFLLYRGRSRLHGSEKTKGQLINKWPTCPQRCQAQIWNITLDNLALRVPDSSGLPFQFQVFTLPNPLSLLLAWFIISQLQTKCILCPSLCVSASQWDFQGPKSSHATLVSSFPDKAAPPNVKPSPCLAHLLPACLSNSIFVLYSSLHIGCLG